MSDVRAAGVSRLPTIEGARVRLRRMDARDVPALLAIFGALEVVRWTSLPLLTSEADALALLDDIAARCAERSLFQWGVARRADDLVIGTFTIADVNVRHGTATVGYAFGQAHWGQGYLRETLPLGLRFAFEVLGMHRIGADSDPRNHASMRALERAGFRREGYQRGVYRQYGEVQDAVLYGLLREEWETGARGSDVPSFITSPRERSAMEPG